jgi:four helix bundle protein
MNPVPMKQRTRAFAVRLMRLVDSLPNGLASTVIGKQLLRCGTSVGANYRAACRARSQAQFIAKLGIVEEEADETVYWIELLVDSNLTQKTRVEKLLDEANQIVAIVVTSIKTARKNERFPASQSAIRNPKSATEGA